MERLLVHCLDVDQPIAANLAAEETLFIRALGHDRLSACSLRQWPAAGLSLLAIAIVLTAAMLSGH